MLQTRQLDEISLIYLNVTISAFLNHVASSCANLSLDVIHARIYLEGPFSKTLIPGEWQ